MDSFCEGRRHDFTGSASLLVVLTGFFSTFTVLRTVALDLWSHERISNPSTLPVFPNRLGSPFDKTFSEQVLRSAGSSVTGLFFLHIKVTPSLNFKTRLCSSLRKNSVNSWSFFMMIESMEFSVGTPKTKYVWQTNCSRLMKTLYVCDLHDDFDMHDCSFCFGDTPRCALLWSTFSIVSEFFCQLNPLTAPATFLVPSITWNMGGCVIDLFPFGWQHSPSKRPRT